MKLFTKCFFSGSMCLALLVPHSVLGLSANSCNTGGAYQYCGWGRSCKECPENCYCPGRSNASDVSCTGWTGISCSADKGIRSNTDAKIDEGSFGIKLCPSDFPLSNSSAKSAEDCYASCGGTKIYNKKIHCDRGYFLHYKSNTCYKCEGRDNDASLSKNAICVGGDFYPTCGMNNQGVQECPGGKVPNTARTECISASAKCSSNEALINGKCEKCGIGTKPNDDHTDCIIDKNSVPAGKYLPKGQSTPVTCKGRENKTYYYCPGGDYVTSDDGDQGIFKCGSGEIANDDRTGCSKLINQNKMQECWLLIDNPEKFKECVLK